MFTFAEFNDPVAFGFTDGLLKLGWLNTFKPSCSSKALSSYQGILLKVETLYHLQPGSRLSRHREFAPAQEEASDKSLSSKEITDPQGTSKATVTAEPIAALPVTPCRSKEISKEKKVFEETKSDSAFPSKSPPNPVTEIPSSTSLDGMLQRLLVIVEEQSQTIESQHRRILVLEDRHSQYVQALENMEAKMDKLSRMGSKEAEPQPKDDAGTMLEI